MKTTQSSKDIETALQLYSHLESSMTIQADSELYWNATFVCGLFHGMAGHLLLLNLLLLWLCSATACSSACCDGGRGEPGMLAACEVGGGSAGAA